MDPEADLAAEKAGFCLATGIAPSEYDQLTQLELAAFIAEHNEIQRRREAANRKAGG